MKLSLVAISFLLLALAAASPREYDEEFGIQDKSIPSAGLALLTTGLDLSSPCCEKYSNKEFPKNVVKDYFYTSGNCRLFSVVFVLKNGKTGCADPNAQWARDLMEYIDSIKHSPSSRPTTVPIPSA
ncbi:C-C motif chemokine 5-like [Podarcis raffonei]|uniref:C-C motif chemokine 5-like n=1 Tax=Podarcis raffonei TaxID=65483 RepID=UPI002329774C|nr:C-C motif chemokine 5-like [Podarcis raffonei]